MPFTSSVSPINEKAAKPSGIVVEETRMKDAGKELEEEKKGSKEDDDRRKRGRKGEEDLDDDEIAEQPGASLESRKDDEVRGEDGAKTTTTEEEIGEDFEVRRHKIGRQPVLPTKAEIEEHFPLHLQYRSWCPHCVAGKARSNQHATKDKDEERLGVTWNADYAFMGGEYNEQEEGMQASLVMYDDDKESFWAIGVNEKGATETMVKYGVGTIELSGYNGEKISFKSDQEPSIVALKSAIAATRVGETVPLESPERASKSNGMMENCVKIWQGQLRTIKHYVESRLGKRLNRVVRCFRGLFRFVQIS